MKILTSKRVPGFSLLELIVAASIIAILATVTVINTTESRAKARDANRRTSVDAYSTSMEQWKSISKDKSYFVYMTGGVDCTASHGSGNNPLGADYGYMSGSQSTCVGVKGGGGGRITRKSLGAYYPSANSVADALKFAGVLNAIRVDPTAENQPLSGNFPDFVLTTCDSNGYAASNAKDATEFAIFARLERAGVVSNNPDVVDPKQLCGGDATKGWDTIYDWGGI
jgi:prepilin-type N-terminal cleavage/methylation domain-containing protein